MRTKLRINCASCAKRPYCKELCDRAREYAEQDQVSLKEKTLGRPLLYSTWGVWDRYLIEDSGVSLNDRQICVMILTSSGVPSKIIKKGMKISQDALDNSLRVIRNQYETIQKTKEGVL